MYAVIRTGGKQYRVEEGQILEIDRIPGAPETLEFTDVLLVGDGASVTTGTPTVADARVVARNLGDTRGPKIIVYKYKAKTRYRRKAGFRAQQQRVRIESISIGAAQEAPRPKRTRKKAESAAPADAPAGEE